MQNSKGMSLVEVMIALAVVGVVSAGVGSMMLNAFKSNRNIGIIRNLDDTTRKVRAIIEEPGHLTATLNQQSTIFGTASTGCRANPAACAAINTEMSFFDSSRGSAAATPNRLTGTTASPVFYAVEGQRCDPATGAACPDTRFPIMALSRVQGSGAGVRFFFCFLVRDSATARRSIPKVFHGADVSQTASCESIYRLSGLSVARQPFLRPLNSTYAPSSWINLSQRIGCNAGQIMMGFKLNGDPDCATPTPTPTPTPISLPGGTCAGGVVIGMNPNGSPQCGLVPATALAGIVPACGAGSLLSFNGTAFTCQNIRPLRCELTVNFRPQPPRLDDVETHQFAIGCPPESTPMGCWSQTSPCGLEYCNNNGAQMSGGYCTSWVRRRHHDSTATTVVGISCLPTNFATPFASGATPASTVEGHPRINNANASCFY